MFFALCYLFSGLVLIVICYVLFVVDCRCLRLVVGCWLSLFVYRCFWCLSCVVACPLIVACCGLVLACLLFVLRCLLFVVRRFVLIVGCGCLVVRCCLFASFDVVIGCL